MFKNTAIIICLLTLTTLSFTKVAYNRYWDLSQNKINTLNKSSKELLDKLDSPLQIDIYSPNIDIINICNELMQRYSTYNKQIEIYTHQTILDPIQSSKLRLLTDHNIIATYKQQSKAIDIKIASLSEEMISNLIQQTMQTKTQWAVFLTGHLEADPFDSSELGLSNFSSLLQEQGMHVAQLNLAQEQHIPDNTTLLIVVNPQTDLLKLEKDLLHKYLAAGKQLLWFTEPDSPAHEFLNSEFNIQVAPGIAVDPNSLQLGSPHPAVKIITQHPEHPINHNFNTATILPWSGHLITSNTPDKNKWQIQPFMRTNENTWIYNGPATMDVNILAQHKAQTGPLTIGLSFSRPYEQHDQRILVIADSSFVLNKYFELFTNAKYSANITTWLQENTAAFVISPHKGKDFSYTPNKLSRILQTVFFPVILPICFIGMGFYLQRR